MLRKADRLASRDIDRLSQGKSVFGTLFSMRFAAADRLKISASASKKVAAKAVDRNRLRRRSYAAARAAMKGINKPAFIMLMPKKDCFSAPLAAMEADLKALFQKAGLS